MPIALCLLLLFSFTGGPSYAVLYQEVGISGSPNPVGSGARALGMGGAFIGVADDATAASWNPGGLIQLETPEISLVSAYDQRHEERSFVLTPDASGSHTLSLWDLNYLSVAVPFAAAGRNMIVSLNYQSLFDFDKRLVSIYDFTTPAPVQAGTTSKFTEIEGRLKALSPAFAVQATPTFSFGVALNWYNDDLQADWKTRYTNRFEGTFAGNPYVSDVFYTEENRVNGTSFTVGFLWSATASLTVGAVYKSPCSADLTHREAWRIYETQPAPNPPLLSEGAYADERTLVLPASYGVGLAWRFSDAFSVDLDVYRTDWQDYIVRAGDGTELSPIVEGPRAGVDTQPTHQVRFGGEYLFIRDRFAIPLRAGVFYDPEPTGHTPDDFFGISLGSGIAFGPVVFDAAYQFRWGNDVRKVTILNETVGQDVRQHTLYLSVIYHF